MNSLKLQIASFIIHRLPLTRCFEIKCSMYRWAGATIGSNVRIASSAKICGDGKLEIGDNTWIGHEVLIVCSDHISIGSDCDIAPRVFIGDGTHVIDKSSPNVAGAGKMLPVKIGNGCWLCANSTILPGSEIGEKCIIAAGSVFKGKSNPLEVWGGVIAKKIKDL